MILLLVIFVARCPPKKQISILPPSVSLIVDTLPGAVSHGFGIGELSQGGRKVTEEELCVAVDGISVGIAEVQRMGLLVVGVRAV